MIINDDEDKDKYEDKDKQGDDKDNNVDRIPDRTGRQWQGVLFGGPAMREFDQPRFCDLSLIIMITMGRRRRNLIIIMSCMMSKMSHCTWL